MNEIEKAIEYFDGYGSPYDDIVIQALQEKAEREKHPNGWIPVSEKWPNKSGHYITTYREWADGEYFPVYDVTRVKILRYHDAVFILPKCLNDEAEQDIHREVIAWQPLPETYKGDAK